MAGGTEAALVGGWGSAHRSPCEGCRDRQRRYVTGKDRLPGAGQSFVKMAGCTFEVLFLESEDRGLGRRRLCQEQPPVPGS